MTGSLRNNETIESFVRANTRMIVKHAVENPSSSSSNKRLYKCKDCNKEYDSFQALGGHRASHRAPRPGDQELETRSKVKLHECKICKKGFEIGQSLGGHMRKHWRKEAKDNNNNNHSGSSCSSSTVSPSNCEMVFNYDLNLTPHENERVINGVKIDQDSSSPES